jgi:glutamate/tyrosine decarboxylase-like PLP-dependent enzyme
MAERKSIPTQGENKETLLDQMRAFGEDDPDWDRGRTWSLVYYAGEEHYEFLKQAHNLYFSANGLNPMAFQSLKRMESEVVDMTGQMLNGGDGVVGTMTSGGTESILMAVKASRERARKKRLWLRKPNIVAPETLHVAFDKAAHYFDLEIRRAPVDENFQADVDAMRQLVDRNTVLLAASAPQYPQGMVDPIPEIGKLAQEKGIPFHVDACFGGFMLPWLEKLGYEFPTWDFRVPGVTSISADVHKYGYAAKGASVVCYRNMDYLKHQFFVATGWSGGIYASPSMQGTRPGGAIAAAWASLMGMGEDGFTELAAETMEAKEELRSGIEAIDDLEILGSEHATVVTWRSSNPEVDTYAIVDQMEERGWSLDRQQNPACVHCTVSAGNRPAVSAFVDDLGECVEIVRENPQLKSEGNAAMYGLMAKIPLKGAVEMSIRKVMEQMYSPGSADKLDLSEVGSGDDDGPLLQLVNQYGDLAMELLDRVDDLREMLQDFIPGRR